jgi:hypothetical protein
LCQAFRIKDDLKKVIYAVLRCPSEMLELMKECGDSYKWEHGGRAAFDQTQLGILL